MTTPSPPQAANGMVSHYRLSAMGEGLTLYHADTIQLARKVFRQMHATGQFHEIALYAVTENENEICIRRESL